KVTPFCLCSWGFSLGVGFIKKYQLSTLTNAYFTYLTLLSIFSSPFISRYERAFLYLKKYSLTPLFFISMTLESLKFIFKNYFFLHNLSDFLKKTF
uniref:hypothetical protein n=1 Tax=Psychrobacter sp. TaxID=56811 RepID=UPI0028AC30A2